MKVRYSYLLAVAAVEELQEAEKVATFGTVSCSDYAIITSAHEVPKTRSHPTATRSPRAESGRMASGWVPVGALNPLDAAFGRLAGLGLGDSSRTVKPFASSRISHLPDNQMKREAAHTKYPIKSKAKKDFNIRHQI